MATPDSFSLRSSSDIIQLLVALPFFERFAAASTRDREGVVAEGVKHPLDSIAVHAVGGGDDRRASPEPARQRVEDDYGIEVAGVVGDDEERALDAFQVFLSLDRERAAERFDVFVDVPAAEGAAVEACGRAQCPAVRLRFDEIGLRAPFSRAYGCVLLHSCPPVAHSM